MKKHSVLALLLVVLMCISLVFAGCQDSGKTGDDDKNTTNSGEDTFKDPNDQVANAIEKTVSALVNADGVGDILSDAVNGGKITLEAAGMVENVLYMDAKGNRYADVLTIGADGVYTDFEVYLQDNKLAISAPVVFGEAVYGVDLNTAMTDLETAELWAAMGTTYDEFKAQAGIDPDAIMDALDQYMDATENAGEAIMECLKDVEVTREEGEVTVNGEKVKAVNVKYHVTSEDLLAVLNACLDETEKSMDALKESFTNILGDEAMDEIMSNMDMESARQEMADAFETVDLEGDLVVSINPKTQYIMSVSMDISGTVDGEEGAIDIDLVLGVDPTKTDKVSLSLLAEADGERSGYTVEAVRTIDDTMEKLTVSFNEVWDDEIDTVATVEMTYHSSNGAYAVVLSDEYETITINGICKLSDDKLEFSLENVINAYDDYEDAVEIDLRLVVELIDASEIPEMPAMKNVLKLTADEWTELIGSFQGTAEPDDSYDDFYGDDYYEESEPEFSFNQYAA